MPERQPITSENFAEASIKGIPKARFWGDEWPKYGIDIVETYTDDEGEYSRVEDHVGPSSIRPSLMAITRSTIRWS